MPKVWEPVFPNLGAYECHSARTPISGRLPRYNCWAFAVGENSKRWEPDPSGQYYWPPGVPRNYSVAAFSSAYQTKGYQPCADGVLTQGVEKIVLYALASGRVTHAARQIPDGRWISKLGDEEDIIHQSPNALVGVCYGYPILFMSRPLR
jgi:hypothetical protein